jgi:hypothetical protein
MTGMQNSVTLGTKAIGAAPVLVSTDNPCPICLSIRRLLCLSSPHLPMSP